MNTDNANIVLEGRTLCIHFYFAQTPEDFEILDIVENGEPVDIGVDEAEVRDLVLDALEEAAEADMARQDDYWENRARMELH